MLVLLENPAHEGQITLVDGVRNSLLEVRNAFVVNGLGAGQGKRLNLFSCSSRKTTVVKLACST